MALTRLDPAPALVVVDLQKFIFAVPGGTAHPPGEIIDRAARLVRAFRERGLLVVLVRVLGTTPGRGRTDLGMSPYPRPADWSELVPALDQHPGDLVITKPRWDAFIGTALDFQLRQRGVTQLFLAGVATSIGVESTARSASDHGYNVVPVVDAMTDRDAEAHRHTVGKIFPRLGEVANTDEVLKLVSERPLAPGGN